MPSPRYPLIFNESAFAQIPAVAFFLKNAFLGKTFLAQLNLLMLKTVYAAIRSHSQMLLLFFPWYNFPMEKLWQ